MLKTGNVRSDYRTNLLFGLISLILLYVVCLCGCTAQTRLHCVEHRAAVDMGSATIKIKAVNIDRCANIRSDILFQKNVKVAFSENIRDNRLSDDVQNKGLEQLAKLKSEAKLQGAQQFAGVATAVFRSAINTSQYLDRIKGETGIAIRLISQDEEAILGYQAAKASDQAGPVVVWDIGGNSMQMITQDHAKRYVIYRGKTASVSFKKLILEKIQHKPASLSASPNPIGDKNLAAAIDLAMDAARDVPDEITMLIAQNQTRVIGIGGVHNQSIKNQMNAKDHYTRDHLMQTLLSRVDLTDAQIGGPYADTDVSNLILVLGYMQKLKIDQVYLKDVNLTDGVLTDPSFWDSF
jgi:exopolyphosphatase / guanosine-5'-triphosphate,3'-diphosphate pyrophosphatase